MKRLLTTLCVLLFVTGLFGANPAYDAFLGTNGIIITSNPPSGKIIVDGRALTNGLTPGGSVSFADLLWTNEPAGRIHPITFTNRVELQRSLTIGTNTATFFGAPSTNDLFFAGRDITKAEQWSPKVAMGAFSNSVASYANFTFAHNVSGLDQVVIDENGNTSIATLFARSGAGGPGAPSISLVSTSGFVPFANSSLTNTTIRNVIYQFPAAQGAAGTALTNNGSGSLGWGTVSAAGSGLTTNANQFLGVPLSIKDSALFTNTVNFGAGFLGAVTNIMTAPQFLGSNVVFDGSISSWFQFNPATGPQTNYVFTNIQAGQTITVKTYVTNGTTVRLWANTTEIPAAWYVGNNGSAANINSNAPSVVYVSRDPLIPATNVTVWTRDLETVAGANITFTTNFPAGTVSIASSGGGGIGFGDLVWTNEDGNIHLIESGYELLLELTNNYVSGRANSWRFRNALGTSTWLTFSNTLFYPTMPLGVDIGGAGGATSVFIDGAGNVYGGITGGATYWLVENGGNAMFASNKFVIDTSGDLIKLKDVDYSWPSSQGAAGTVLTNNGSGVLGWGTVAGGGGSVAFGDLVWTNKLGRIYPIAYPTNIIFAPTNTGPGGQSTTTNFLFQTSTRRVGGTNVLFAVFNGGASALVVGDQGIMIGSTNYIPVPQAAIDIAYDMAFGVDTPEKSILLTTYHSTVGYSGNAEMHVSTNYGDFNVTANKEGNGFVEYFARAGGVGTGVNYLNFDSYVLIQDEGATVITPLQFDPDFSMSPTSYIFGTTMRVTNIHTLMSLQNSNTPMFEVNGIGDLKLLKRVAYSWPSAQGAAQTVLTNDGSGNLGWGAVTGGSGLLSGTTNFFNLSVQAAKVGVTNYPAFNNGYDAWETTYYETNAEGSRAVLGANWQFMVPDDYTTNSLQLLINYSILNTNGPNTSNVIFGASVLVGRSGTTNNIRTNLFGFTAWGTNDWIAKYDGTNYVTNLVINLGTNAALKAGDLSVLKVQRDAINDTYGGPVSIHGLQLKYVRQ
jgi:hypothetical protein